ncbi:hypothetical protein IH785_15415 [candidate division KSB1 bacterium]|nr:hypothetical protein [candidate division KSB1 bacterium]
MKKNIIMQYKSYLLKIPRVLSNPKNWLAKLGWGDIWAWLAGIVLVYAFLFGIGKIVFGKALIGMLHLGIAALSGFVIYRHFTKGGWETRTD